MRRTGIYEILKLNADIRKHISINTNLNELRDISLKDGMRPLKISGVQKVVYGITTLEEVYPAPPHH